MPYFLADISLEGGKLQIEYVNKSGGRDSNPEEAKIFDDKRDAEQEALGQNTEPQIIFFPKTV
jgi:hypothetical protein